MEEQNLKLSNSIDAIGMYLMLNWGGKPNLTDSAFMSSVNIFQQAILDKMCDMQNAEHMNTVEREKMADKLVEDIQSLILTYTGYRSLEAVTGINNINQQ